MYKIIKDGEVIGIVEKPRYIRKVDGIYIQAEESEAQGVAVDSMPYNLPDGGMEGLETVTVSEVDGGEYILTQQSAIDAMLRSVLEG